MKRSFAKASVCLLSLAAVAPAPFTLAAFAALTPEQETARIARQLKPIPDEEWSTIAGTKISETYEIIKGDTLYDISKRLFGDGKYWPKVWALNNATITNPHRIRPGNAIAFTPGTGTSLPALALQSAENPNANGKPAATVTDTGRSQEWRDLPRQSWEASAMEVPKEVDKLGWDSRSRVSYRQANGFELPIMAASEKVPLLGQVVGSRSEGNYLGLTDAIYIRAEEELQVGEVYALTQAPAILKSPKSDRIGYAYQILGKVRIIGVRDNLFIGTILGSRDFVARGAAVIPMPARVPELTPVAGPSPLEGILLMDKQAATYLTAQHRHVFIDRGADDGITPGMVFRAYQYFDPSNDKKITTSNFIIDADIIVAQVSPRFSMGVVLTSLSPVVENSTVTLLTDVSDLMRHRGIREKLAPDEEHNKELDELDKLDGQGLGKDEERELKQLERWKGNPPPGTPPAEGGETIPPPPPPPGAEGELPPPPAAEGELAPPPPPPSTDVPPPPPAEDSLPPPPPPTAEGELAPPPPPPAPAPDDLPPPPGPEGF